MINKPNDGPADRAHHKHTLRPVAFRVYNPHGGYWLTEEEGIAQRWCHEYSTTYEGLYLVADRKTSDPPSD